MSLESAELPSYLPGTYILYSFDKAGFEKIQGQLSGDDWFFHDAAKYPNPSAESLLTGDDRVTVWMHYDHQQKSGASKILAKMSPDRTGEMKFLKGWTSISLEMDESGNLKSIYGSA